MAHLEIKHLRMIRMIARTKNLTKAASELFVSQPALSQQLKDIETKLGADLFFRTGKIMAPTRIGKTLLKRADVVLEEIGQAELEVAKAVYGETGELKIGLRCMFCFKWLPEAIKQFQVNYPKVDLEISSSMKPEKELTSKAFDMVILASSLDNHKMCCVPLFEDEMVCVMSKADPLSQKKFLEIEDFHGKDMISLVDRTVPSFYDVVFKNKKVRFRKLMTIAHPEAIVDLVEAGLGVTIMPRWFISSYASAKDIHTCSLTSKKTRLRWKACYLKNASVSDFQEEFMNIITSQPFAKNF